MYFFYGSPSLNTFRFGLTALPLGKEGERWETGCLLFIPPLTRTRTMMLAYQWSLNPQLWATTRGWPLDSQPRVVRLRLDWVRDSCFDLRDLMPTSFWGRCVIEEDKAQYHPNYYDRAPSHFHNKFMLISWAPLQFRNCAPTLKPPRQSEEKTKSFKLTLT